MKFLFLVLFLVILQPAIATEAFNEDELAALKKIKASVEGRLRYNQVLLDILSEEGVDASTKLTRYAGEINCPESNFRVWGVGSDLAPVAVENFQSSINHDLNLLKITLKILDECLTSQENSSESLAFLQMNLDISHKKHYDEYSSSTNHDCSAEFYEHFFYKIMCNYTQVFRLPPFYKDISESISFKNNRIRSFTTGATDSSALYRKAQSILSKKEQLQTQESMINECSECILRWESAMELIDSEEILSPDITLYETQKKFFKIGKTIADFRELAPKLDEVMGILAEKAERELLGEDTTNKKLTKAEIKRRNKQKGAEKPSVVNPAISALSSSSASLRKLKPVHLPPCDRSHHSAAPAGGMSNAEMESKVVNAAAPAVSAATTSASASSSSVSSTTSSWSDAVSSIRQPRILEFRHALDIFRDDFGATIEEGTICTISLRGPTGALTNIYCHNSHGAQDDKRWPAWRINMKDGLRAAGFEW